MKMDDYKNSDNFQRTEGSKMILPHHFHPTNGVRPSDSMDKQNKYDSETEHGTIPDKQDEWNKKYE
jgi:siderophore synthetase component